jgi:transcription initiation factor TFIID TATA-box-binding protein
MTQIKIENIVADAQIAGDLDIKQLAEKSPDFNYNPDEFKGLTLKIDKPKTAILLLPNGKAFCTGAKNMDDVKTSLKIATDEIKNLGIKVKQKYKHQIQNIIVSINLKKELNLKAISKGLMAQNVNYDPEQFPGLIYRPKDSKEVLLVFSSGKIVCTGAKKIEDASKAIEMMKNKLTSLGVL